MGVRLLVVFCSPPCSNNPSLSFRFCSTLLFFPSYCSQGWRISIAVDLTGSVVLIGQWRGSTVAALTCICIAEPQPGNTRSILMTSPHTLLPPSSVFCWNKLALTQRERNRHQGKNKSKLGRGGAACKRMKRERERESSLGGGGRWLTMLVG